MLSLSQNMYTKYILMYVRAGYDDKFKQIVYGIDNALCWFLINNIQER